ncbi:MAG TPA: glycosyltransferase family 4 protein, partial [Bacteroidetes bacterium]|nr:glycosyltransferase family 4 protein [Bacteroidota bacterium]
YNSADIAMIPHIKSGHTDNTIPHKIFQYMYAQIPIVTSNCDPLVRIVEENYCGVSYTFDNPAELSEIIARFAKNKELLYEYIKHGKKAVVEKYNWKNDSKTLCDLYAYLSEEA